jgi:hypothetical protein
VFKNIFEQTKFVESYRSSDIETELHLDRKKLIFLAHLLGSDYAAGVHGIGKMEIKYPLRTNVVSNIERSGLSMLVGQAL